MPQVIASDATITDVLDKLAQPEDYVRRVLAAFYQLNVSNARVRIGTSGKGPYPCYRIVHDGPNGSEEVLGAFNDNGTPFITAESSESWSSRALSMDEVKQLLGRIRDAKKRRV